MPGLRPYLRAQCGIRGTLELAQVRLTGRVQELCGSCVGTSLSRSDNGHQTSSSPFPSTAVPSRLTRHSSLRGTVTHARHPGQLGRALKPLDSEATEALPTSGPRSDATGGGQPICHRPRWPSPLLERAGCGEHCHLGQGQAVPGARPHKRIGGLQDRLWLTQPGFILAQDRYPTAHHGHLVATLQGESLHNARAGLTTACVQEPLDPLIEALYQTGTPPGETPSSGRLVPRPIEHRKEASSRAEAVGLCPGGGRVDATGRQDLLGASGRRGPVAQAHRPARPRHPVRDGIDPAWRQSQAALTYRDRSDQLPHRVPRKSALRSCHRHPLRGSLVPRRPTSMQPGAAS